MMKMWIILFMTVFNRSRCASPIELDSFQSEVYIHSSGLTPQSSDAFQGASSATSLPLPMTLTLMTSRDPCRVLVTTLPGQHIDFVLFSFGHQFEVEPNGLAADRQPLADVSDHIDDEQISGRLDTRCSESIHVVDGDVETSATLCQPRQRRQLLYSSTSSTVWIYFSPSGVTADRRRLHYVLKLEANGCADFVAPANAWVERFNDRIVVRCNFSQETWYMTCKGTEWIGEVTNCTDSVMPMNGEIFIGRRRKLPVGLLMAVFTGVVLGVVFGLMMLVIVLLYKRRQTGQHRANSKTNVLLNGNDSWTSTSQYQQPYYTHRHRRDNDGTCAQLCPGHNGQQINVEMHNCLPLPPPPPSSATWQQNIVRTENQLSLISATHPATYDIRKGKRCDTAFSVPIETLQEPTRLRRLERPSSIPLTVHHCLSNNANFSNNNNNNNGNNNIVSDGDNSCGPDIVQSRPRIAATSCEPSRKCT